MLNRLRSMPGSSARTSSAMPTATQLDTSASCGSVDRATSSQHSTPLFWWVSSVKSGIDSSWKISQAPTLSTLHPRPMTESRRSANRDAQESTQGSLGSSHRSPWQSVDAAVCRSVRVRLAAIVTECRSVDSVVPRRLKTLDTVTLLHFVQSRQRMHCMSPPIWRGPPP